MSIAKRLDEQVQDGRLTEAEADEFLETRTAIWNQQEKNGQFLLCMTSTAPADHLNSPGQKRGFVS